MKKKSLNTLRSSQTHQYLALLNQQFPFSIILQFQFMNIFSIQALKLLLILLVFCKCANWQAYGNFSQQKMVNIFDIINKFENDLGEQPESQISGLPLLISDQLNKQWGTGWNVFALESDKEDNSQDSLFYGYAYNDQWLWLNNYGKLHLSYIIWKDFNCKKWLDYYSNVTTGTQGQNYMKTHNNLIKDFIHYVKIGRGDYYLDPWQFAFDLTNYIIQKVGGAWTTVISANGQQKISPYFFARYCTASKNGPFYTDKITVDIDGDERVISFFSFQTRSN